VPVRFRRLSRREGLILVGLDALAWLAIQSLSGYLAYRLPESVFRTERWWSRPRAFEDGGRLYRRLGIDRWKGRLPEAGGLFAGGFSKRSMRSRDTAYLERFVAETRRAEAGHLMAFGASPLFALFNPLWIVPLHLLYGALSNLPFVAIQRYNRFRLLRLLERRRAAEAAGES